MFLQMQTDIKVSDHEGSSAIKCSSWELAKGQMRYILSKNLDPCPKMFGDVELKIVG